MRDRHLEEEGGDRGPHKVPYLSHKREEIREQPYHVDHQTHYEQQRLLGP